MMRLLVAAGVSLGLFVFGPAAHAAEQGPYTPVPRQKQAATAVQFDMRALGATACRAGQRQCMMGPYITWCCRADQQCDDAYPGGCR